jgi:hypothetical protein
MQTPRYRGLAAAKIVGLLFLTSALFLCYSVGLPPSVAEGRMTGGGSVFTEDGARVTHGLQLHCNVTRSPNNLEVNWGPGMAFHLEVITSAACFDNSTFDSKKPRAPMDTIFGRGTGRLNDGTPATAEWTFTDRGEPGTEDTARIFIWDQNSNLILAVDPDRPLTFGNHQAHKEHP